MKTFTATIPTENENETITIANIPAWVILFAEYQNAGGELSLNDWADQNGIAKTWEG